jgi:hypothetical protein
MDLQSTFSTSSKYMFKALHGQAPTYIRNMLDIYTPSRQLRSQNDCLALVVSRSRTVTYGDRDFMTAAPKLWNALPRTLKSCETLTVFKRALKTHLFKRFLFGLIIFLGSYLNFIIYMGLFNFLKLHLI